MSKYLRNNHFRFQSNGNNHDQSMIQKYFDVRLSCCKIIRAVNITVIFLHSEDFMFTFGKKYEKRKKTPKLEIEANYNVLKTGLKIV